MEERLSPVVASGGLRAEALPEGNQGFAIGNRAVFLYRGGRDLSWPRYYMNIAKEAYKLFCHRLSYLENPDDEPYA